MSDNLKTQKTKIILIEKFCQKMKVFLLLLFISFVKDSSKTIQVVFNALYMQDSPTFGALSN